MAKQLRFLVLDLCSPRAGTHGDSSHGPDELKETIAKALKELFDYVALRTSTLTFVLALFVAHDSGIEVLLKPQKFQLGNYREAVARLSRLHLNGDSAMREDKNSLAALTLVSQYIKVFVTFVYRRFLHFEHADLETSLQPFVEEDTTMVDFQCVSPMATSGNEPALGSTDVAELVRLKGRSGILLGQALLLRSWVNCSVHRLYEDDSSFSKLFRSWIIPKVRTLQLKLPAPRRDMLNILSTVRVQQGESIYLDMSQEIQDIGVAHTNICRCCQLATQASENCAQSNSRLQPTQIATVYSLGSTIFKTRCSDKAVDSSPILMQVKKRVHLRSVSESLFIGQAHVLSSCTDPQLEWEEMLSNEEKIKALWMLLTEKTIGLLLYTRCDCEGTLGPLINYFLLFPSSDESSCSFLLRQVAVREQLLPWSAKSSCTAKPDAHVMQSLSKALEEVAEGDFNPLEYSTNLHAFVDQLMEQNSAPDNSRPATPRPASTTNSARLTGVKRNRALGTI